MKGFPFVGDPGMKLSVGAQIPSVLPSLAAKKVFLRDPISATSKRNPAVHKSEKDKKSGRACSARRPYKLSADKGSLAKRPDHLKGKPRQEARRPSKGPA